MKLLPDLIAPELTQRTDLRAGKYAQDEHECDAECAEHEEPPIERSAIRASKAHALTIFRMTRGRHAGVDLYQAAHFPVA